MHTVRVHHICGNTHFRYSGNVRSSDAIPENRNRQFIKFVVYGAVFLINLLSHYARIRVERFIKVWSHQYDVPVECRHDMSSCVCVSPFVDGNGIESVSIVRQTKMNQKSAAAYGIQHEGSLSCQKLPK